MALRRLALAESSEARELKECTFQPSISPSSKLIRRSVDDLLNWKKINDEKSITEKFALLQTKRMFSPEINHNSRKIVKKSKSPAHKRLHDLANQWESNRQEALANLGLKSRKPLMNQNSQKIMKKKEMKLRKSLVEHSNAIDYFYASESPKVNEEAVTSSTRKPKIQNNAGFKKR